MEVSQVAETPGAGETTRPEPGASDSGETAGAHDLFAILIAQLLQMSEAVVAEDAGTGEGVDVSSTAVVLVPEGAEDDGGSPGAAMSEGALEGLVAQLDAVPMRSSATYQELPAPSESLPIPNQASPDEKAPAPMPIGDFDPDGVVAEKLESLVDSARLDTESASKTLKLFETMMRAAVSRAAMNPNPGGRAGEEVPRASGPPGGHVEVVTLEAVPAPPAASGLTVKTDLDIAQVVSERVVPEPATSTLDNLGRVTVRSVRYLVARGEATMRVRLEPPSLGEVRFDVTSVDRVLSIRLVSANPAVREILEGHLGGLRESLVRDGHHVLEVSVTADAASGHSTAHEHRRPSTFNEGPRGSPTAPPDYEPDAEATDLPEESMATHAGALNLLI